VGLALDDVDRLENHPRHVAPSADVVQCEPRQRDDLFDGLASERVGARVEAAFVQGKDQDRQIVGGGVPTFRRRDQGRALSRCV